MTYGFSLAGRKVIVTGAAGDIGAATVQALAHRAQSLF